MISVIIPLYNKGLSVKNSIKSVLNQTYTDFEIIIVNDGSTDNSLEIANSISDNRIRIYSKKNEGVSVARNYGITKARGEIISFLDADDIWLPNYLENVYTMYKQDNEVGMYIQNMIQIPQEKKKETLEKLKNITIGERDIKIYDNWAEVFHKLSYITSTISIKKELINSVGGFDRTLVLGEDQDLWLRCGIRTKVAYTPVINTMILFYGKEYHSDRKKYSPEKYHGYKWAMEKEKMLSYKSKGIEKAVNIGIQHGSVLFYREKRYDLAKLLLTKITPKYLDLRNLTKYIILSVLLKFKKG